MARLRFGVGEYKYFAAPLPPLVAALRVDLYRHLAPIANRWMEAMGVVAERFPPALGAYLARCAAHGQTRPTRCSSATRPAATSACTRISTARSPFRCR